MKIQIMSDVHVEFFRMDSEKWICSQAPGPDVDLLVLAGDIDVAAGLTKTLRLFCQIWPQVVFVAGNHEYYGSSPRQIQQIREELTSVPNLHWLDNEVKEVCGLQILGGTLWYPRPTQKIGVIQDHLRIGGFIPWVYEQNAEMRRLVDVHGSDVDLVISHHLPASEAIAPNYLGSSINHYFCDDLGEKIREKKPPMWIFGHTHTPFDGMVGETRLVCNPKGYPGERPGEYSAVTYEISRC